MSENYLPVKESLGYKNVKKALMNIFDVELDTIPIHEGKYENFSFQFQYRWIGMTIGISSTAKNLQFEAGEGGIFNIWFPNFDSGKFSIIFLNDLVNDDRVKRVFGDKEADIEYTMQVLKDYLDQKCEEDGFLPKR